LMRRCAGIKQDGQQCTVTVEPPQRYCWWHDPANSDKRRRAASKGGRGRAAKEVRDLKAELRALVEDVKSGQLDRNDAGVMIQAYRALKDFIELERRIKETDELADQIEELKREYEFAG
jgi:ribosomal protein L29